MKSAWKELCNFSISNDLNPTNLSNPSSLQINSQLVAGGAGGRGEALGIEVKQQKWKIDLLENQFWDLWISGNCILSIFHILGRPTRFPVFNFSTNFHSADLYMTVWYMLTNVMTYISMGTARSIFPGMLVSQGLGGGSRDGIDNDGEQLFHLARPLDYHAPGPNIAFKYSLTSMWKRHDLQFHCSNDMWKRYCIQTDQRTVWDIPRICHACRLKRSKPRSTYNSQDIRAN